MGLYIKKLPRDIEIGEMVSVIGSKLVRKIEFSTSDPPFFIFVFKDLELCPLADEELYIYKDD